MDALAQTPQNLRIADLIAKSARVTLKDTLRVLAATSAVSILYDADRGDFLTSCDYDADRPTPEQVAACEQAFFALREASKCHPDIDSLNQLIKALK